MVLFLGVNYLLGDHGVAVKYFCILYSALYPFAHISTILRLYMSCNAIIQTKNETITFTFEDIDC